MNSKIRYVALLGVMGAFGLAQAATTAINEVEPNNTPATAQPIDLSNGPVSISGTLGNGGTPDVDYYKFFAHANDVLTFDIDGGISNPDADPATSDRDVDTVIAIYDANTLGMPIASNHDAPDLDPGSVSTDDARLDNVQFTHDGYYIIGVTSNCNFLSNGRVACGTPFDVGQYTLVISPPPPPVIQISIDVIPGRSDIVPLDSRFERDIPVALLSSKDFDATQVDTTTLTFGATGDEQSLRHCHRHARDANRDGLVDLICDFKASAAGFEVGDTQGVLKGKTMDGRKFEGHGTLKVVAEKRHHGRYRHIHWLPPYSASAHDRDNDHD